MGLGLIHLLMALTVSPALASGSSLVDKVLEAGVPRESLVRIQRFLQENEGRDLYQQTYDCPGREPGNPIPCPDDQQIRSSKVIRINKPRFIGVIDFSRPSSEKRFFVIDLKTGNVNKYHVSHGGGSGDKEFASKFSNRRNSNQTALGLYQVGEKYPGAHGATLRLYGLEKSNDQAYNRNIVLHSAAYAVQRGAGQPVGRSSGCPAVSAKTLKQIIPLLKDGGLIDFYYPGLMEQALIGREVHAQR